MSENELMTKSEKMMTVCNSCRYCEGFCAVWPAMEFRRAFPPRDMNYLANLCHDCGECYYACQYAPPHEFDVNPPLTFAKIRVQSYEKYAWPGIMAEAFRKNRFLVSLLSALTLIIFIVGFGALGSESLTVPVPGGDFYRITPHGMLVTVFSLVAVFVLTALAVGFTRFWRDIGEKLSDFVNPTALLTALKETLRLEYLDDLGWGCTYPEDKHSQARRWFHHSTFYGFLLCFTATTVGAFYHFILEWNAPYGYLSLPVILGTLGGIGLVIGPVGLLVLKSRRNRDISDGDQYQIDVSFTVLLLLTSVSGLLLLALRETAAMGVLLVVHLGFVMGLFLTLPYGKFVHGIYRFAALVKYALERARKKALGV